MNRKLKRIIVASLFTGILVGTETTNFLTINQETAQAAVIGGNINEKTILTTDFQQIKNIGANYGQFVVENSALAEFQLLLKGNKTAAIKIPDELKGYVSLTADAQVTVQMGLDLSENVKLIKDLLTESNKALVTLSQLIDDQSLLGFSINAEEVYTALDAVNQLVNVDLVQSSSKVVISDDGAVLNAEFNEATIKLLATKVYEIVSHLKSAISTFEMQGASRPVLVPVINIALLPVKMIVNAYLDQFPNQINMVPEFVKLLGDAAILKSSKIIFPVSLNLDKNWFKNNAPNGLVTEVFASIDESNLISINLFEKQGNNIIPLVFSDIIAPNVPIVSNINAEKDGFSFDITAESGSIITVYNNEDTILTSSNSVPGTADGKTAGKISLDVKADPGSKLVVKATDKSGNESMPLEFYLPTKSDKNIPLYRAYNPNSGEHLYTKDKTELNDLISNGWMDEDIAWITPSEGVIVYRSYNPNSGEHFYTKDLDEFERIIEQGWENEGIGFYSNIDKDQNNSIYRVFNPNASGPGSHHFTSSIEERNNLILRGWTDEKEAFYSIIEN
ncbi:hypothetical protein KUA55_05375 [Enterococcus sp. ALS3]|uniref:Uncharacterized protein n=1 Tax=Enterococcus alishanensis TaxID=1303817 RepID=A0ABS6TB17_9ENTE|nr:adhesive domain-containing protein [Enterococcus alishanensis]MBV7390103.1 hypothetical protein [Enterococcus alishanensis]